MPRLPILRAREVIRALEKVGLKKIWQKESRVLMQHPNGNTTLAPLHSGRDIDRALLQKTIADAETTQEGFAGLLVTCPSSKFRHNNERTALRVNTNGCSQSGR